MLNLIPAHKGTIIDSAISAKNAIEYHEKNIAPFYSEMQNWERKEYERVNAKNMEILNKAKNDMLDLEWCFNDMLSEYKITVTIFIAKYLNR